MIRVLLVDDRALLRMGFRMILEAEPDITVVGKAGDGAAGVSMTAALRPDVVLMDVRMPGVDGIEATTAITRAAPARVLILTTYDLDQYVYTGLRAGASVTGTPSSRATSKAGFSGKAGSRNSRGTVTVRLSHYGPGRGPVSMPRQARSRPHAT